MKSFFKKIIIFIITAQARLVLRKYKPTIIAVTGNVGKTTTKDAIYAVLSKTHYVRKSEKSFNSELGVPLTILGCANAWSNVLHWLKNIIEGCALIILKNHYPKILVLEIGADRPGDIEAIARWLRPNIVVVTRIGDIPVHVEFFSSPEELVEEKGYLVSALQPGGTLLLNSDSTHTLSLKDKAPKDVNIETFGMEASSSIRAIKPKIMYEKSHPAGISFTAEYGDDKALVDIRGTVGQHFIPAFLVSLLVGVYFDISLQSGTEWLKRFTIPPGRMKILEGRKGSVLIDDSYNASPAATEEALHALAKIRKGRGRKIAVLGDMAELGRYTETAHQDIGKLAKDACDFLVLVGIRSRHIGEGALRGGMKKRQIFALESAEEAGEHLKKMVDKNDIVLIKGSQMMRMERAVEAALAHPEQKKDFLVRQEPEWLKR